MYIGVRTACIYIFIYMYMYVWLFGKSSDACARLRSDASMVAVQINRLGLYVSAE